MLHDMYTVSLVSVHLTCIAYRDNPCAWRFLASQFQAVRTLVISFRCWSLGYFRLRSACTHFISTHLHCLDLGDTQVHTRLETTRGQGITYTSYGRTDIQYEPQAAKQDKEHVE